MRLCALQEKSEAAKQRNYVVDRFMVKINTFAIHAVVFIRKEAPFEGNFRILNTPIAPDEKVFTFFITCFIV